MNPCPNESDLQSVIEGAATGELREEVARHAETCPECRLLLEMAEQERDRPPQPQPGDVLGRYHLERVLGTGAMGVVFLARDALLDRRVALKLLGSREGAPRRELMARLEREAQALARISHPNVVVVHDFGVASTEQVFVALEYVEGCNLREWLGTPRTGTEIASVFQQAAAGLQAAHAAGVVHRDVKPENVLVGADGRTRVADFGLARSAAPEEAPAPGLEPSSPRGFTTQHDRVLGTPGYIAPEVSRGAVADARSDQFSFCTALGEALSRPAGAPPPEWLLAVARRGADPDPASRFPSMSEVLEALESDPARRGRPRWIGAVAALVALVLGASGVWAWRHDRQRCRREATAALSAWTDRRERAERAFTSSSAPDASTSWAQVRALLDGYANAWIEERSAACEEARRGLTIELDGRIDCLRRRGEELASLTALLAEPDTQTIAIAPAAARRLIPPLACRETEAAVVTLPGETWEALERAEAQVQALEWASRFPEAREQAGRLEAAARDAGAAEPLAWALTEQARFIGLSEDASDETAGKRRDKLREAIHLSEAAGLDEGVADARLEYLKSYCDGYQALPGVEEAMAEASAAVTRTGSRPRLRAALDRQLGICLLAEGRFTESARAFQRANQTLALLYGPSAVQLALGLQWLAAPLCEAGRYRAARANSEQALSILEHEEGPTHGDLSFTLLQLGSIALQQRRLLEAQAYFERALRIDQGVLGEDSPELLPDFTALGDACLRQGKLDAARGYLARAQAFLKTRAEDSDSGSSLLLDQGELALAEGHPKDAIPLLKRLVAMVAGRTGARIEPAEARFALARALWDADDDRSRARQLAETALAAYQWPEAEDGAFAQEIDTWLATHPQP